MVCVLIFAHSARLLNPKTFFESDPNGGASPKINVDARNGVRDGNSGPSKAVAIFEFKNE